MRHILIHIACKELFVASLQLFDMPSSYYKSHLLFFIPKYRIALSMHYRYTYNQHVCLGEGAVLSSLIPNTTHHTHSKSSGILNV